MDIKNSQRRWSFALCSLTFCLLIFHKHSFADECNNCIQLGLDPIPACDAEAYFVDNTNGSDLNGGTESSPWATIAKARNSAPSGATICVLPGNYGSYKETNPPAINQRQTIRGLPGEVAPTFTNISFDYSTVQESYLTMSGINVFGNSVADVVRVNRTKNLRLNNFDVKNTPWSINNKGVVGVELRETVNTIFDNSKVSDIHRGIQVVSTTGTRIVRNFIQPRAGTGIQYLGGNAKGEIAHNNIQGAEYVSYPENPEAVIDPHASIISLRSGDVIIRGNHLHGMGTSSGVMFYQPDASGGEDAYSNVQFENNAVYHINNNYALRIYNLGSNFTVSNNTLFSRVRTGDCNGATKDARYRYNTAMVVHNQGPGSEGLRLYNNIMLGIVSVGTEKILEESNNYAWSWNSGGWLDTSPNGSSSIVTSSYSGCGNHNPIFENGSGLENFNSYNDFSFTRNPVDFTPAVTSPIVNFGDPSHQPEFSLGNVQSDGFVSLCAAKRSNSQSSAGAYEIGSCDDPEPPIPPLTLLSDQWRQFGLPCDPGNSATVSSLFSNDILGNYGEDWIIWEFDAINNGYLDIGLQSILRQGVGYWILQSTGQTQELTMPASCLQTQKFVSTNCPVTEGCFSTDLVPQYQLLAYPFSYAGPVSATFVSTSNEACVEGCAFGSEAANELVTDVLWSYKDGAYQQLSPGDTFSPWDAFWAHGSTNLTGSSGQLSFGQ